MELHRVIRKDARRLLSTVWGRSLAALLILLGVYLLIVTVESALLFTFSGEDVFSFSALDPQTATTETLLITGGALFVSLLTLPAGAAGYTRLHLSFAVEKTEGLEPLFQFFSSVRKLLASAVFSVVLALRMGICFALALMPGAFLASFLWFYMPVTSRTLQMLQIGACLLSVLLLLLCLSLALIFTRRWFLAPYYFARGEGIHRSFVLSVRATKGLHTKIMRFSLSFFGWAVLSLLILPLLWCVPYYSTASALYAEYLMERYERSLEPEEPEL